MAEIGTQTFAGLMAAASPQRQNALQYLSGIMNTNQQEAARTGNAAVTSEYNNARQAVGLDPQSPQYILQKAFEQVNRGEISPEQYFAITRQYGSPK